MAMPVSAAEVNGASVKETISVETDNSEKADTEIISLKTKELAEVGVDGPGTKEELDAEEEASTKEGLDTVAEPGTEEELGIETEPEVEEEELAIYNAAIVASGTCGTNATYTITGDVTNGYVLSITADGAMDDYDYDYNGTYSTTTPWDGYRHDIVKVEMIGGTRVGNAAFFGMERLTKVNLPDTLSSIGYFAFENCTSLASISLPWNSKGGLTTIREDAFHGCTSLQEIEVPNTVTELGAGAFQYCEALESVTLSSNLTSIKNDVFYGCSSLKKMVIPEGVTTIGISAFGWCTALESVTLPSTLTTIYSEAFLDCPKLLSVTIPKNVTTIGKQAFGYIRKQPNTENFTIYGYAYSKADTYADDNGLTFVMLGGTCGSDLNFTITGDETAGYVLTITGSGTMNKYTTGTDVINSAPWNSIAKDIVKVEMQGGTNIGAGAFACMERLESVTLPSTLVTIEKNAFKGCTSLKTIVIPEGVSTIHYGAFYDCTSLSSVTLPDSLTSIEDCAFCNCPNLKKITIPKEIQYIDDYVVGFTYDAATKEYTKMDDFTIFGYAYDNDPYYTDYVCTATEDYAMEYSIRFVPVAGKCGENLSYVMEENAGSGLTLKISGTGPMYSYSIKDYKPSIPWWSCLEDVTKIEMTGGTYTCYKAFDGMKNLKEVELPDSLTMISMSMFNCCKSLESISIPESVTSIGDLAFSQCRSLKSIVIPEGTTTIGMSAFYNCTSLESVTLPSTLETVYDSAFFGCEKLTSITIPESVSFIDYDAFGIMYDTSTKPYQRVNVEGFTIYGTPGSAAEAYAKEYNVPFRLPGGTCGTGLTYSYEGDATNGYILRIKGVGAMDSYRPVAVAGSSDGTMTTTAPWSDMADKIVKVVMEGGTTVGMYAFAYMPNLKAVELPSAMETITTYAFKGCTSLESIRIPEGIKVVLPETFEGCKNLKTVSMPSTLATILYKAFYGCSALEKVDLPDSLTMIGDQAFANCTNMKSIYLSKKVGTLGDNAVGMQFDERTQQYSVIDGFIIFGVGDSCGEAYANAKHITFVAKSGSCGNMLSYNIENKADGYVLKISGSGDMNSYLLSADEETNMSKTTAPWAYFADQIVEVEMTGGNNVGAYAFAFMSNLKKVTLPSALKGICPNAFMSCSSLKSITIPDGATYVMGNAFQESGLETVELPQTVTFLGNAAFKDCKSLTSASLPGVSTLPEETFYGCTSLRNVILPESITTINSNTFYGCESLESIILPKCVSTIESGAFYGCTSLAEVVFPSGAEDMGVRTDAFTNCPNLKSIKIITNAVISPHSLGFCYDEDTKEYTMVEDFAITAYPNAMMSDAEKYALNNGFTFIPLCGDNLTYTIAGEAENGYVLTLGGTGPMKNYTAFSAGIYSAPWDSYSKDIIKVDLGGATTIGAYAFGNCTRLKKMEISDKVTKIEEKGVGYWFDKDASQYKIVNGFMIIGDPDSVAETYAKENGIPFRSMNSNPSLDSYSLTLDDQRNGDDGIASGRIGMNFYFDFFPSSVAEDGYVKIGDAIYPIAEARVVEDEEKPLYGFSYYVRAKEMGKTLTLTVCDKNMTSVAIDIAAGESTERTVDAFTCTVRDYLQDAMEMGGELGELAAAMNAYGNYAQLYFDYDYDSMTMLPNLDDVDFSAYEKEVQGTLPEGITYFASSLLLKDTITIRHYFVTSTDTNISSFKFYLDGEEVQPQAKGSNIYVVDVPNMKPLDIDKSSTVTVSTLKSGASAENAYKLSYSVLSYGYAVMNSESSESLVNLLKSIYFYNDAAKKYFR